VWGFKGDTEKAKARFERTQPDRLLTNLAEAVEYFTGPTRPEIRSSVQGEAEAVCVKR
jgi:hypothetical protein